MKDIEMAQQIYDELLDFLYRDQNNDNTNLSPALKYLCLRIARIERLLKEYKN